ncbi:MAG: patatin-like phospholipase family protein [Deltaproteobacteria bacterium]|nr:patatin-like phospholipase family protein [Deltaproteobacteria bacterium]
MFSERKQRRAARRAMESALTYEDWLAAAETLDALEHNDAWLEDERSNYYDHEVIREDVARFESCLAREDAPALVELLEEALTQHHHDLLNPRLYCETYSGETKHLPRRFLELAVRALNWLADEKRTGLPDEAKLERLFQAQHKFGRSALMLSGGATLGIYHLGVVKALFLRGLLPSIISGSSMGAIVAAGVCTRTDEENARMFAHPEEVHRVAVRFKGLRQIARDKSLFGHEQLLEHIRTNMGGDYTFAEAFAKTGRVLNISVAPTRSRQKPRILNHLTAPDLLVTYSAAVSCAMPFLFEPAMLMTRGPEGEPVPYLPRERWIDGSVGGDVPMARVGRLHNVNHFIVSQTNAHVYLFAGKSEQESLAQAGLALASELTTSHLASILGASSRYIENERVRRRLGRLHDLMAQPYVGDINIHPRVDPAMLRKIVANPSLADFEKFILEGERVTWPKVAMIRDQTRISRAFEAVIARVEARAASIV